ncbi:cytosolic non-specific dipeptidase [Ischnura elegans]|uniref:cytosolic non-specific dipeptidase n=1 Tax=Ischnura elegans TaxID=197161 RepID=UPI001ED8A2B2|nr:cytosolic non-specific dipeptidase [Ischnura elegans]XP_046390580.1 cytosolic non-specific dipeptidase [Ischnura elegans]
MDLPPPLQKLFGYVDGHKDAFISNLREAVAIPSVSAWPENRKDIVEMAQWTAKKLEALGAEIEMCDVNDPKNPPKDEKSRLPPVILGVLGKDPAKKTVCVYGHLDVQPARKEDGWDTDPFVLTEKEGRLYGRGSTDDKGPVLGWIHAIEAFINTKQDIPVNIKFVFEGMEESGSEGLDDLLYARKDTFFKDVDHVCISDNYWLGKNKPCLTYGLRGVCYFFIDVECASMDLHSGVFGGTVSEGLADLIYLMNTLVDKDGKILVTGLLDDVEPVTPDENKLYTDIDFDVDVYRQDVGAQKLLHNEEKIELLMHRWRHPSLSLHGIEGAFAEPGCKTIIPRHVIGKFSVRIVPNMTPEKVEACVVKYLEEMWKIRGSHNKMKASMSHGGRWWKSDPTGPNFEAGRAATRHVYGVEPDMTREGGSIPVTLTFEEVTGGRGVLLLPMGSADDGAHAQNEKINVKNYIEGTKLLGAYLYEIAQK